MSRGGKFYEAFTQPLLMFAGFTRSIQYGDHETGTDGNRDPGRNPVGLLYSRAADCEARKSGDEPRPQAAGPDTCQPAGADAPPCQNRNFRANWITRAPPDDVIRP